MERKLSRPEIEYAHSARILAERFIQRWDVHALQLADGRYINVKKPLNIRLVSKHLKGEITLATYLLDEKDLAKETVIDADDDVQYHQLFKMAHALREENIPSYMESSRRGGHLHFFHETPVTGLEAKTFGEELLAEFHLESMEVFPKQESTNGGVGSCIRLPFGIHRKSGKRYPFVDGDGLPLAPTVQEQLLILRDARTVSGEALELYTSDALKRAKRHPIGALDNPWERIRQAKRAIDFIGRYIELTPTDTGGVGYCPFHEDKVKSFGVHRKGNYWHCFAGCGGGSIIDFWMKWRKVEFGEAVHELKELLEV